MPWTSPAPTPNPHPPQKKFLEPCMKPLPTNIRFVWSEQDFNNEKDTQDMIKKDNIWGVRTENSWYTVFSNCCCLKSKCHRDLATNHHTFSFSFLWTLQPLFGYLLFALVLYLSFYWHIMIFFSVFSVMLLPFSSDFLLCLHQPPTLLPFSSSLLGSLSHH